MEPEESSQDAVSQPFVEESSKGKDKAVSQPFKAKSAKGEVKAKSAKGKVRAAERSTRGSFERLKLTGLAGTMGSDPSRMWMGLDKWVLDTREEYHWSSGPQLLLDRVKLSSGLEKGSVRTERFKIPGVRCRQGRERNVVSVQQLARDHGLVTVFEPTGCYVKDKAETIVGQGRSRNGKYVLNYLDITKAQEKGIRDVKTSPDQGSLAGSQPEWERPDKRCWFGQTRLDRHSSMLSHELGGLYFGMRSDFLMDSGACHHVTCKGDVLKAYHADLQIRPPIQSVTIRERHRLFPRALPVDGIGYIDSAGGSLDRVLFVPTSHANLVSVSQLTEDYSVRVVFDEDGFWIEKLETKESIGGGIHHDSIGHDCAYMLTCFNVGAESDWVLDSFAWLHHTSDRRLLYNLQQKAEVMPTAAVDDQLQILEHGSVRTERFKVPKVRYIAGHATRNVISVAQLAYDHGLVTVFEPTGCHVKDKQTGQIVGKGRLSDGTYVLDYLRIGQAQGQDVVDASLPPDLQGSQELQGRGPRPQLEWLGEAGRFGRPRSDRAKDPTIAVFQTLPHNQPRTMDFYMASGERHHMTWNGAILMAYHADMHINPPIQYVTGVLPWPRLTVDGIGYIDSKAGSLDRVLFVPSSSVNTVSVSQLTEDCSVRVVFDKDEFWMEKLETKERIGHGRCFGTKYVVARLEVGAASYWVLDSFAWQHHTPDRRLLYDLQEKADDQPQPGGDQLQILGSVRTKRFKVPKVRYIADHAARNAISVVQLADDHGLVTVFEPRFCYVKDKETGQIVGQGRLRNGTYVLDYLRIDQDKRGGAGGGGGDGEEEEKEKGGSEAGGGGGEKKEKDKEGGGGGGETGGGADGEGSGDDKGGGEKGKKEGGGGEKEEEEEEEEEEEKKEEEEENDEEEKLKEPSQTQCDMENDEEEKLKEPSRAQGDIEKDEDKQLTEPSLAQGDMFGLLRFDRAPDQAVSDPCHRYHFLGSDVYAHTALAASLNQVPSDDVFVDSGACFHITWNPSVLQRYPDHLNVVLPTQSISGVSGSNITVEYSGYINNAQTQLDGVLFVPGSTANLVSVGQLTWQYYVCLEFDREVITIRRKIDGVEIGRANRRGNHYLLQHFRPGRLYVEKPSPNFWGPQHQFSA
ncbi:uncharacterized protein LOC133901101 isoform X2 [Phragmites australis]|uniref:uncharacterized protein LOC133901101 isoform X2 n=1 Tax=Phragmites australis TaxID=29695 RepID=UPI002D78391B|nr:uncharacterized protein LOC133901101 isoform X2 [Phragmites australis]